MEPVIVEEGAGIRDIFRAVEQQAPGDWQRWQAVLAGCLEATKLYAVELADRESEEQVQLRAISQTVSVVLEALGSLPELAPHLGYLELLRSELLNLRGGIKSKALSPTARGRRGRPAASKIHLLQVGQVAAAVEIMRPWCDTIADAVQFVSRLLDREANKGQPIRGWQGEAVTASTVEEWHSKCSTDCADKLTCSTFRACCAVAEDVFEAHSSRLKAVKAATWFIADSARPPDLTPSGHSG